MYEEKLKDKPTPSQPWFNLSRRNITWKPLFIATALMCLSLIWTFHFTSVHHTVQGLPAKNVCINSPPVYHDAKTLSLSTNIIIQ